jgi:hypothetical protein
MKRITQAFASPGAAIVTTPPPKPRNQSAGSYSIITPTSPR